jgi:hypothetical protein
MTPLPDRSRVSERASLVPCRRCRHLVLEALVDGLETYVDLPALDRRLEAIVLLLGRCTFEARSWGGGLSDDRTKVDYRPIILWRTPERIRDNSRQPLAVLAEHVCRPGPPGGTLPDWYLGVQQRPEQPDEPPF